MFVWNWSEGRFFVWNWREERFFANLARLTLLLRLRAALGSWQYPVLNRAVDCVDQLFQVCRVKLRYLAVLADAAPGASLDKACLEDLKLDQLVVLRQPDVPLPVALFSSESLKLYRCDIVHTRWCSKPYAPTCTPGPKLVQFKDSTLCTAHDRDLGDRSLLLSHIHPQCISASEKNLIAIGHQPINQSTNQPHPSSVHLRV